MRKLCVIEGDGIGREVVPVAVNVLKRLIPDLEIVPARAGWDCFQDCGEAVPEETLSRLRECGAGLFGAVSSPSQKIEGYSSAILKMRRALDLYSNIRPVRSLPGVSSREDVDMIIVRENTEGLYSGIERREVGRAITERVITESACRRIATRAMKLAGTRSRKLLTMVHKANIMPLSDGLFRETVQDVANQSAIQLDEALVDLAALKMVAAPESFDVVVTTNLFGDILSDVASHWMGGMGLAPSLNLGDTHALAEPVHGSAPDIAGQGIANPIATVLAASLLVRFHWDLPEIADRIDHAVSRSLQQQETATSRTVEIEASILAQCA